MAALLLLLEMRNTYIFVLIRTQRVTHYYYCVVEDLKPLYTDTTSHVVLKKYFSEIFVEIAEEMFSCYL